MPVHRFSAKLGVVKMTQRVSDIELVSVAAAIQRHIVENFSPVWDVSSSVSPFLTPESLPLGYTPIFIRDDVPDPRVGGFHRTASGLPYAVVQYSRYEWPLDASHEALELLTDAFGDSVIAGDSLVPSQGRVNFLVEVCDPSGRLDAAHPVDGFPMADFYTPRYFDSVTAPNVKYSFSGKITRPKQILRDGYIAWSVPDGSLQGQWWLADRFGGTLHINRIPPPRLGATMREGIDLATAVARGKVSGVSSRRCAKFLKQRKGVLRASRMHAHQFESHFQELLTSLTN